MMAGSPGSAESIVLFGGPKDGAVIEVVDGHPPLEWLIPIPPGIQDMLQGPKDPTRPELRVGVYTPRADKFGRVECSLAGHPIYEWKGER